VAGESSSLSQQQQVDSCIAGAAAQVCPDSIAARALGIRPAHHISTRDWKTNPKMTP